MLICLGYSLHAYLGVSHSKLHRQIWKCQTVQLSRYALQLLFKRCGISSNTTGIMIPMYAHNYMIAENQQFKLWTDFFNLLGVEQNNDVAKGLFFRNSNKWDATTDILKNEHRMADLSSRVREKRPYK